MFGSLGIPELLAIGIIAMISAVWPIAFFALGYYFGRRSMRNAGLPPESTPPHV